MTYGKRILSGVLSLLFHIAYKISCPNERFNLILVDYHLLKISQRENCVKTGPTLVEE